MCHLHLITYQKNSKESLFLFCQTSWLLASPCLPLPDNLPFHLWTIQAKNCPLRPGIFTLELTFIILPYWSMYSKISTMSECVKYFSNFDFVVMSKNSESDSSLNKSLICPSLIASSNLERVLEIKKLIQRLVSRMTFKLLLAIPFLANGFHFLGNFF